MPVVPPTPRSRFRLTSWPDELLLYLMPSRYCETDRASPTSPGRCSATRAGLGRGFRPITEFRQQSCVTFAIRPHHMKSAHDVYEPGHRRMPRFRAPGAHLLPLHGHSGELLHGLHGRVRRAPDPAPMDFSGWFSVYLSGQWYTFDARHNHPRIGRILMATGRDAAGRRADHELRADGFGEIPRHQRRGGWRDSHCRPLRGAICPP